MSRTVFIDWQGNEIEPPKADPVPMTNGERIRYMSDYDMADWIANILSYHSMFVRSLSRVGIDAECDSECPLYKCCNDQPIDNIEGWLKAPEEQEADNGTEALPVLWGKSRDKSKQKT